MTTNILFAISDTGGGHRSAALAISGTLEQLYGNQITCTVKDLLRATNLPLVKNAPKLYDYCSSRQLWLHNLGFRLTNGRHRIDQLSKIAYNHARNNILQELSAAQPDLVVVTHPLAIRLICAARKDGGFHWPVVTVVTDLATIHASWAYSGPDLYLVPTQEAYDTLLRLGIPQNKMTVTGFPVHPKFNFCHYTQSEARLQLGLNPDQFTFMVTSGGVGSGKVFKLVTALEELCPDKQLLVVTGHNRKLYRALHQERRNPDTMHIYSFVNNMDVMMAASDVVVTKGGTGTLMEILSMHRPLIVTEAVGLQEQGNIDFVLNNQVGFFCSKPEQVGKMINHMAATGFGPAFAQHNIPVDGATQIANILMRILANS